MKRGMVIAAVLLFFTVAVESKAEMKITPGGVTTPNDSGALKLSGSFSEYHGQVGAVVFGENNYIGSYKSYGGVFIAHGPYGRGVYGYAPNTGDGANYGGFFVAEAPVGIGVSGHSMGINGLGVEGYALGEWGIGVYGIAGGESGLGVCGEANNSGNVTNYGGHFAAAGTSGYGVYAIATGANGKGVYGEAYNNGNVANYGGYFTAAGTSGYGVYAKAAGAYSTGVYGYGVYYDFYAGGPGTNYGPFTGAHDVKFGADMPEDIIPGLIVSATGRAEVRKDTDGKVSLSSTLPTVTLSAAAMDKAVFGVIVSQGPLPRDHWYESKTGERFGVVNALGEGRVWVTDRNGNIEAGDYITTSVIPGYGQKQEDDLLHAYTLGKAIETIDWDQVAEAVQHDGKAYKAYLIAVVYTSG